MKQSSHIPVEKFWYGPKLTQVTINLMVGTTELDEVVLNAGNLWKGSFDDLPKYYENGDPILYSITEDPLTNYDTDIDGDMSTGFDITNTNNEKVDIPVRKVWIGDVGPEVTINLLRDTIKVGELKLNVGNVWQGSFTNLPKYHNDGHEYGYTITEDAVPNYSTVIRGNSADGFVITNTYRNPGVLLPTQTSIQMYATGAWPPMYERFDYQVKSDKINSVSPGVIFYYNTIIAEGSTIDLTVTQSNTKGWKPMLVQGTGGKIQAYLYNEDYQIVATGTYDTDAMIDFHYTSAVEGEKYYIGIKYSPANLKGQPVIRVGGLYPTSIYSFYIYAMSQASIPVSFKES